MQAKEVKELLKLTGWADEYLAVEIGVSLKSIYNYKTKGCSRKGTSKILKRLLDRAKMDKGAA